MESVKRTSVLNVRVSLIILARIAINTRSIRNNVNADFAMIS